MLPRVKEGDRVLIHAGSGGVGHFAIQIAKQLGAYVVTTSSAKNRDFVMSLGADEHIDYREKKFEEVAADIDFSRRRVLRKSGISVDSEPCSA